MELLLITVIKKKMKSNLFNICVSIMKIENGNINN